MNFLLDENLPPRLATLLSIAARDRPSHKVFHLAADLKFRGLPDADWIEKLDPVERWAIITHDIRISSRPHVLAAWKRAGHIMFFLSSAWQKKEFEEQCWMIIRWWSTIVDSAEKANAGTAFKVPCLARPTRLLPL